MDRIWLLRVGQYRLKNSAGGTMPALPDPVTSAIDPFSVSYYSSEPSSGVTFGSTRMLSASAWITQFTIILSPNPRSGFT